MAEEEASDDAPDCCKGCAVWQQHGRNCWVYWESKKQCSMHTGESDGFLRN